MTKWEQLAALLTGGNKPNPLLGMMAAQNPLYTADPTQTVDAARAFSQGMSSAAIGSIPGSGVVNAAGIQPRYDENWFIPAGITQGPNIRENLQSGNYLDAGLQGLGLLGDAASVGAMASMVPKSAQRGGINIADDLNYRGTHTAPVKDGYSAPIHRLTDLYPEDIYSSNAAQFYGHYGQNNPMDMQSVSILQSLRDKPNQKVTIYRAVPYQESPAEMLANIEEAKRIYMKRGNLTKWAQDNGYKSYNELYDAADKLKNMPPQSEQPLQLNPGDWVTINRQYAKEHGESALGGKYKIVSKKVPASEIYTDANSIHEFGWSPSGFKK